MVEPETPARTDLVGGDLRRDSLVGSYFHSGADRGWQGMVVAEPHPGTYLVETFDWVSGGGHDQRLITVEQMVQEQWCFYDTADWMRKAYQHSVGQRWERERHGSSGGETDHAG